MNSISIRSAVTPVALAALAALASGASEPQRPATKLAECGLTIALPAALPDVKRGA